MKTPKTILTEAGPLTVVPPLPGESQDDAVARCIAMMEAQKAQDEKPEPEPKLCPLMMAALLVGNGERIKEKTEAGWDRCQGCDCAWWQVDRCGMLAPGPLHAAPLAERSPS